MSVFRNVYALSSAHAPLIDALSNGTPLQIGTTNASSITLANAGVTTNVRGIYQADLQDSAYRLQVGTTDPNGHRQLWWFGTNDPNPAGPSYAGLGPEIRIGSSTSVGDSIDVISEGTIAFGQKWGGDQMTSDDYSILRTHPNFIQIDNADSTTIGENTVFKANGDVLEWSGASNPTPIMSCSSAGLALTEPLLADTIRTLTGGTLIIGSDASAITIGAPMVTLTNLGDGVINGNLIVYGITTIVDTVSISTDGSYSYVNSGYTANIPQTGGLVNTYLPTTTASYVGGAFVPGVVGVSNPYVTIVDMDVFSPGDIISISDANTSTNNGLYEVESNSGLTLTIRGVGLVSNIEDFTKEQFVADSTVGGLVTKVNVTIMRSGLDGLWEYSKSATTPLTYTDFMLTGISSHASLTGLLADDHPQYALLDGRAAGQTLYGGTLAGNSLTLDSTSHASKGSIIAASPLKVSNIDTLAAGELKVGTTTATQVTIGSATAPTITTGTFTYQRPLLQSITTTNASADPTPTISQLVPLLIFTNNAVFSYTLPSGTSQIDGMTLIFINESTGAKTIAAGAGNTIDGAASFTLASQHDRAMILYWHAGARWFTF